MKTTPTKRKKKKTKKSGTSFLKGAVFASIFSILLPAAPARQITPQAPAPDNTRGSSSSSRAIEGTVLSSKGAPVAGAIVQIKDSKTLQVRSYIAQQDGKYQFWGLSNDVNYQLRAMAGGFTSKSKTVSVFNSRRKITLDLKLTQKFKP